jgi:hypothetical protein
MVVPATFAGMIGQFNHRYLYPEQGLSELWIIRCHKQTPNQYIDVSY